MGLAKTTFAREFLPNEACCPVFVNSDLIAAGLAPFAPETAAIQAGRLMLQELDRHFVAWESFAFEATLSGRGYLRLISQWQRAGYRVKQGGHYIPEDVVRRRFATGLKNFESLYAPVVGGWALYDVAGNEPVLVDWSEKP